MFKLWLHNSCSGLSTGHHLSLLCRLSRNSMVLSVPVIIQFEILCWYLLTLTCFSGKCSWYDVCIKFSNIQGFGRIGSSAFKYARTFRLRRPVWYLSRDDSVSVAFYTYLGGIGHLSNILKLTKQEKWSKIPFKSTEAGIWFFPCMGLCKMFGLNGYEINWQYEWGTKFWGKNYWYTSYRRNLHISLVHWLVEEGWCWNRIIPQHSYFLFLKLIYNWRHFIDKGFDVFVFCYCHGEVCKCFQWLTAHADHVRWHE